MRLFLSEMGSYRININSVLVNLIGIIARLQSSSLNYRCFHLFDQPVFTFNATLIHVAFIERLRSPLNFFDSKESECAQQQKQQSPNTDNEINFALFL